MILYYILALFAISAALHLYRGEIITGLGVNLSTTSFDSGSESAPYVVTLNSGKTALEAGDLGTAPQDLLDAKATKSTTTLDLSTDGNFTAGTVYIVKNGNNITLRLTAEATHTSSSQVSTASEFIPSDFRPVTSGASNMYSQSGSLQYLVTVTTTGILRFTYRDHTGSLSATTGSTNSVTISYSS